MINYRYLIIFIVFSFLSFIGCNSLQKEYDIVKEIQKDGHSTRMNDLTPEKIAERGFEGEEQNHIVKLILSNQNLSVLSSKIGQLKYLKRLELDGNDLNQIPDEIGELRSMEYLDISGNKLTAIPESLKNLTRIKTLYLHRNQLSRIPEYFESYSQLEDLSVMNNQIKAFDPQITKLPRLMNFNIDSNFICQVPENIQSWLAEHSGPHWRITQRCK